MCILRFSTSFYSETFGNILNVVKADMDVEHNAEEEEKTDFKDTNTFSRCKKKIPKLKLVLMMDTQCIRKSIRCTTDRR